MHLSRIHGSPGPGALAAPLIQRLGAECADRNRPVFVAERPTTMTVTVIEGDQFYSGGSATSWDGRPAIELADRVIDWRRQLLEREGEAYRADWEARWSAAEAHYFDTVMPAERFDLVLGRG